MKKTIHLADNQLVEMYAAGNNQAFDTLLFRHKDKVYSYIFLIVRNRELTEDIFQETFIKAINVIRQGRYVDSGKFLPWINRIAYNLIIDYFRKSKRENVFTCDDNEVFNQYVQAECSVEDILVHEQVLVDVLQLLDYLPQNQHDIVRMRIFEGLSFQEIADETNVSLNTALGRMRYALINLRKLAMENNILAS